MVFVKPNFAKKCFAEGLRRFNAAALFLILSLKEEICVEIWILFVLGLHCWYQMI